MRLNVGPRDVANNVVEVVRRDTGEKIRGVSQAGLANELAGLLAAVQKNIYDKALAFRKENTHQISEWAQFGSTLDEKNSR